MRNTGLILIILGLIFLSTNGFALLAPTILAVPATTIEKPMNPYQECAMWGHYRCICPPEVIQAMDDCAMWGHYRCICGEIP